MLFHEQKTISSFQETVKMFRKTAQKNTNLTNRKKKHKIDDYYQKYKNMSSSWQCSRYQLYELTIMKESENWKQKMKAIINNINVK